ncbi:MazG-like family protein [Streptomyces sp. NPDC003038]|uniref:MazG-like family protein n=1 Tax=unclassified Streptomyces TaxID=2593676 RepID=UPI0033B903C1
MNGETWRNVELLREWLDAEAAAATTANMRLLRVIKISEELGEVAEAVHGALGANPRKGASHTWADVEKELADVIVTAMVALDTISGDAGKVLETQQDQRAPETDEAPVGDVRLLRVLSISEDMGKVAEALYGALGVTPRGEAAGVSHTWEDVERQLGDLIVTAMRALDVINGDAPSAVDRRLHHLVQRVLGDTRS